MALTSSDINKIKILLEFTIDEKVERLLNSKLEEKLKHLPTKEEFFAREDKLMGELKAIREELETLTYRVSKHSD